MIDDTQPCPMSPADVATIPTAGADHSDTDVSGPLPDVQPVSAEAWAKLGTTGKAKAPPMKNPGPIHLA